MDAKSTKSTQELLQELLPELTDNHFSSHESDLYVLAVPALTSKVFAQLPDLVCRQLQRSDVPGQPWFGKLFWNLAFQHQPYWDAKARTATSPTPQKC